MKDSSLNVIAIAVFSITLMALVGPAVGISPTIPSVIVFSVLAIASLDNFALQGQGTTILTDWLAGASGEKQDRILHHEAGHFLVAHLLEIPVEGYALSAWEAFKQGQKAQGGVRFRDQTVLDQLQQGSLSSELLDRYCRVWMAGIAAESIVYGSALGGADDRQKIYSVWSQLRRPQPEAEVKQRWATLQARNLIENHQLAYEALVKAMAERMPVEECTELIEASDKPEPSEENKEVT
ncbi:MAG: ATP-dependent Zn protease [Microcoleaceae cyanobacterium]